MLKYRRLLYLTLFCTSVLQAEVTNEDIEALRDWINSKRLITVKELGGALSISGDIRAELQKSNEVVKGEAQRRHNNAYDVEFNLSLDYRTEWTWAAARIRFDNDAGLVNEIVGSGTNNKLKLDRAYMGVRLIDDDLHTMDIDIGRRPMNYPFDSKIEFSSNFDGVLFKDSYAFDRVGDFYYQIGAFLINEKIEQAGYVAEIGLLNIARTGFYTKYSLIDWDTKDHEKVPNQFHFIVSQCILGYKFIPQSIDKPVTFYIAGLYNHRARGLGITNGSKSNRGGYVGVWIGQLKMKGDWSFETDYQVLGAQCVPDFDVQGVGLGNAAKNNFYYHTKDDKPILNTRSKAQGNVNYRGFEVTFQYMLTNNLNVFQQWKQAITLDKEIGPFHRFKQYEIEFMYLF